MPRWHDFAGQTPRRRGGITDAAEQPRLAQRDESNRGQDCRRTVFSQPSSKPIAPESHARSVAYVSGEASDLGIHRATLGESILERTE